MISMNERRGAWLVEELAEAADSRSLSIVKRLLVSMGTGVLISMLLSHRASVLSSAGCLLPCRCATLSPPPVQLLADVPNYPYSCATTTSKTGPWWW